MGSYRIRIYGVIYRDYIWLIYIYNIYRGYMGFIYIYIYIEGYI